MPETLNVRTGFSENIVPSTTLTASGNSPNISGLSAVQQLVFQSNVTAASGTTPSLTVTLQDSVDGGANWNTVQALTAQTAGGVQSARVTTVFSDLVRFNYLISGATPSFTFRVDWYTETTAPIPSGAS